MKPIYILNFLLISGIAISQNAKLTLVKNINVIDVKRGVVIKNTNVLIEGEKIKEINAKIEAKNMDAASIIDGSGKYLVPGYFDSHAHMPTKTAPFGYKSYLLSNLLNGVTSMRVLRYSDNNILYKDSIETGKVFGPSLFLCQPPINAFVGYVKLEEQIISYKKSGYLFAKYLCCLSINQFDSLSILLKKHDVPLVGHTHDGNIAPSIKAGARSIEHLKPFTAAYAIDSVLLKRQITEMGKNNMFVCPTIHWYNYSWDQIAKDELYAYPELKYVPAYLVKYWKDKYEDYEKTFIVAKHDQYLKEKKEFQASLKHFDMLLRYMDKSNVKLLVGSDETSFIVPGFGYHRELEFFKKSGLSNLSILKAATINGAECLFKGKEFGSVEVNKIADLVILNSNPLDNTSNLKDIDAVIKFGKYYSVKELQSLLDQSIANDNK
jgi:imidazolonepropionase-like amidohydrolase